MISLDAVAVMYVDIAARIKSDYPEVHDKFPRGAKLLAQSAANRFNQVYEYRRFDFSSAVGASAAAIATLPEAQDMFSVCFTHARSTGPDPLSPPPRQVNILLNSGIRPKTGEAALNYCWGRYCLLKEVFQAVLIEEDLQGIVGDYPRTVTFDEMSALYSQINNQPFSLWDFGDDEYSSGLQVENAAELLAAGMLLPFEEALAVQTKLIDQFGKEGLRVFNYHALADSFKVPQRYVELLVTWQGLEAFLGNVRRAEEGTLVF